ncbi:MAG: ATP-binding cassette domain-containing protein [bacterium]
MIYLQLADIHKSFHEQVVLAGASLSVKQGDRIGLVGPNGVGKTTLLHIAMENLHPDSGVVQRPREVRLGYVSQQDEISSEFTLLLAMIESQTELLQVKEAMDELAPQLAGGEQSVLAAYGELQQQWEHLGGYNLEADIKATLLGLGFSEDDLYRSVNTFSGGERNRAALARALLKKPDLLLLDEPTNHLDIESTVWLEGYLSSFAGALVVVSHDRVFLDQVVNKIAELEKGVLTLYHGNFSRYWEERAERREQQLKQYLEQKAEIERIEDFIRRNIAGQKTRQAQSRRHALTKVERLDAPSGDQKNMALRLAASRRSYQSVLEVEDVSFDYDNRELLRDVGFRIERGEKVGLIGRNGSGKTTLLKLIMEQLPSAEGSIEIGRNVDLRYFDQELSDLVPEQTVLDTIWDVRPEYEAYQLRSYLARFLFFGEDVFKQVKTLSGGEMKKLALARLLAEPANFLILDEPTNHLDINSLEALQRALLDYDGTLLFVSHDRHFLDQVASRILAIEAGQLHDRPGNYSNYINWRESRQPQRERIDKTDKRDSYRLEKREKNIRSARRKRIKELESLIPEQEARIMGLQAQFEDPANASEWEKLARREEMKREAQAEKDKLETEYLRLVEEDEAAGS